MQLDLGLAKGEANKAQDPDTRKRLWLALARHVVEGVVDEHQRGEVGGQGAEGGEGGRGNEEGRIEGDGSSTARGQESIQRAIAFLQEAGGILKLEDVLPLFPEDVLIDDFRVSDHGSLVCPRVCVVFRGGEGGMRLQ